MSTEKTIKIQKNKVLTYSVNKSGFKTVYGSTVVSQNQTINVEMKNLNSQEEPFQLGDRLFGISSFVDYFTPSGTYDVDSLKYVSGKQTTGSGLTNIAVVKETWLSKVEIELGIETPKGTSNNFIFTYNGSTWDITGATTQSNADLEDYGISFDGTAVNGDVITVVETQYNRFAFFVLDANYRSDQSWGPGGIYSYPEDLQIDPSLEIYSATFYYDYIKENKNISSYPIFNYCKNLGDFILPNKIKINAVTPNGFELKYIYNNKNILDTYDPITVANPSATYNLTNWSYTFTCQELHKDNNIAYDYAWTINSSGVFVGWPNGTKYNNNRCIPIFEVPVM